MEQNLKITNKNKFLNYISKNKSVTPNLLSVYTNMNYRTARNMILRAEQEGMLRYNKVFQLYEVIE